MNAHKKVVFLLTIVLLVISAFNTLYPVFKEPNEIDLTAKATDGTVGFELLQSYIVNYNLYRYDTSNNYIELANATPGLPMGVNFSVYYRNGTIADNATIRLIETNGYNAFVPAQGWPPGSPEAGLTQSVSAEAYTNGKESVNFTIIPTGGKDFLLQSNILGNYSLSYEVWAGEELIAYDNLTLATTDIISYNGTKYNVPNEAWLATTRDKILSDYFRIAGWQQLGGGEVINMIVYDNDSDNDTIFNLTVGKPTGLKITLIDDDSLNPISDAEMRITELVGYNVFAPVQAWPSGSPNEGIIVLNYGTANTDSAGQLNFSFVPTGGRDFYLQSGIVGPYNITLEFYNNNALVYARNISVFKDDSFGTAPSGPVETVPNNAWISTTRDKLLSIYFRMSDWIDYG